MNRFEDLHAWQRGRELCRAVYRVSSNSTFSRDYALRDQIRRAAVSVISNIAEGYERGGNRELQQFLSVAKGSTGEIKAQLYVALDVGYIGKEEFEELYLIAAETGRLIGGLMRYVARSPLRGTKYMEKTPTMGPKWRVDPSEPGTRNWSRRDHP